MQSVETHSWLLHYSPRYYSHITQRSSLPGDPQLMLTDNISRGSLAMFMLTWLFVALPPTAKVVFTTGRKILPKLRADGITAKSNAARLRLIGSHLAHLGLILLLLGHVLTTTL